MPLLRGDLRKKLKGETLKGLFGVKIYVWP
jgi:hypothetical protein